MVTNLCCKTQHMHVGMWVRRYAYIHWFARTEERIVQSFIGLQAVSSLLARACHASCKIRVSKAHLQSGA